MFTVPSRYTHGTSTVPSRCTDGTCCGRGTLTLCSRSGHSTLMVCSQSDHGTLTVRSRHTHGTFIIRDNMLYRLLNASVRDRTVPSPWSLVLVRREEYLTGCWLKRDFPCSVTCGQNWRTSDTNETLMVKHFWKLLLRRPKIWQDNVKTATLYVACGEGEWVVCVQCRVQPPGGTNFEAVEIRTAFNTTRSINLLAPELFF